MGTLREHYGNTNRRKSSLMRCGNDECRAGRLEAEQQQLDEREQQQRVPRGKPLKGLEPWPNATSPLRPDSRGCQKFTRLRPAQGLADHPACVITGGQAEKQACAAVSSNCRKPRPGRSMEAVQTGERLRSDQKRLDTPHLAIRYQPPRESTHLRS